MNEMKTIRNSCSPNSQGVEIVGQINSYIDDRLVRIQSDIKTGKVKQVRLFSFCNPF
jgi:hypothetical protein